MFLNGGDALSGLGDAEGEHGEVVVLLGAVAELVGVGLEGLDDVARALRSVRGHRCRGDWYLTSSKVMIKNDQKLIQK